MDLNNKINKINDPLVLSSSIQLSIINESILDKDHVELKNRIIDLFVINEEFFMINDMKIQKSIIKFKIRLYIRLC